MLQTPILLLFFFPLPWAATTQVSPEAKRDATLAHHPSADPSAHDTPTDDTATADAPELHAEVTTIDWGTLIQGEEFEGCFRLENRGTAPLKITEIRSSCGCVVNSTLDTLAAGEAGNVTFKLRTISLNGRGISKSLQVISNHPGPALDLTLKGNVLPLLDHQPKNLALQAFPGEPLSLQADFFKGSPLSVEILSVKPQKGLARVTLECLKAGERYRLRWSAPARSELSRELDTLEFRVRVGDASATADAQQERTVVFNYAVEVLDIIEVSPRSLVFSSKETATLEGRDPDTAKPIIKKVTVQVRKPGVKIELQQATIVKAPPEAFAVKVVEIEAGRSYELQVSTRTWLRYPKVRAVLEFVIVQPAGAGGSAGEAHKHTVNINAQYRR